MILGSGQFQADGHPGNILVMKKGRIGLIDFGQSKQLSSGEQTKVAHMMLALAKCALTTGWVAFCSKVACSTAACHYGLNGYEQRKVAHVSLSLHVALAQCSHALAARTPFSHATPPQSRKRVARPGRSLCAATS